MVPKDYPAVLPTATVIQRLGRACHQSTSAIAARVAKVSASASTRVATGEESQCTNRNTNRVQRANTCPGTSFAHAETAGQETFPDC
jgi:hypothetical protein